MISNSFKSLYTGRYIQQISQYRLFCTSTSATATKTDASKFHLCIIGSGPAGLYTASKVHKHLPDANITVLEKLPYPFGLVRSGISPDHQNEKKVKNTLEKVLIEHPQLIHFVGNVTIDKDIKFQDIQKNFHAVVLACGIEGDRKLGIPLEDKLKNIYFARDFLGWLNGNLKDQNRKFDLTGKNVAIVGQGNVALDVARLLLKKNSDELKKTDITSTAFDQIHKSGVKNIHIIGRRGPLEVSFTNKELREILNLPGINTYINDISTLDLSPEQISKLDRVRKRSYDLLKEHLKPLESEQQLENTDKMNLIFHFLRSPVEFIGDESGGDSLVGMKLEKNELVNDEKTNQLKAVGTKEYIDLQCTSVFRSIGYTGTKQFTGVPFDFKSVSIPNHLGKVRKDVESPEFIPGLYVSGWIKGGPSGSIPNISHSSEETAAQLYLDYSTNQIDLNNSVSGEFGFQSVLSILKNANHRIINYDDWKKIESEEVKRGKEKGKLLEKIIIFDDLTNIINNGN
ncbi:hypothetical protein CYY_001530 [Polysphondylium violaceum]|uniref:NADPH:adrenodoxin oxidoreductase, mitochondrial n=1 Tax=Polysphondylium violaceum TaxID=133409 RepID=A0A8J4V1J5_9MYCE|nr:hypothetical protein CYY_001530 [Polysphondylium violaceum]